jgi:hypothetical protein
MVKSVLLAHSHPLILRRANGGPRVWAGLVGPTVSAAGVRAGLAFCRIHDSSAPRSEAGDRKLLGTGHARRQHCARVSMFRLSQHHHVASRDAISLGRTARAATESVTEGAGRNHAKAWRFACKIAGVRFELHDMKHKCISRLAENPRVSGLAAGWSEHASDTASTTAVVAKPRVLGAMKVGVCELRVDLRPCQKHEVRWQDAADADANRRIHAGMCGDQPG